MRKDFKTQSSLNYEGRAGKIRLESVAKKKSKNLSATNGHGDMNRIA